MKKKVLPKSFVKEWSEFVLNHPNGNIFQSPEMVHVYEKTKNYTPKVNFVIKDKGIVGVLVGVIQKEHKGLIGCFSSRCIIFGGPLAKNDDPEIVDKLLEAHNKETKRKAIYSQFRNLFDIKHHQSIFKRNGYRYEPHLDIHVDLNLHINEYWKNLKSKQKNKIRKSFKNNFVFKQIASKEELQNAYTILKEVYNNAKLPLPDISLFISALDILNGKKNNHIAFFKAEKDGKIIGVRYVLLYKNLIYDWYAGSKKEYYKYNPNDFLPYKVIEWGMNHPEYDIFDFGGAGKPGVPYGVRDHKLKFSGNLVNYGRFQRIHYPVLFNFSKFAFKIWRKLKS